MKASDGIPRRIRVDQYSVGEAAIHAARESVEKMGANPLLTDAVVLLSKAQEKVADYVDETENRDKCWWLLDGDDAEWDTQCGYHVDLAAYQTFSDNFRFCPFCGRALERKI